MTPHIKLPAHLTYFTADPHFGHRAMLHVIPRPYPDVGSMNLDMIRQWNAQIKDTDHVFVLGDVSFMGNAATLEILGKLAGRKYLVEGNHDRNMNGAVQSMFEWVAPMVELNVDGQPIVMCHYPLRVWNRSHYGSWQLHGHSHGSCTAVGRQLDVGVDSKVPRSGLLYTFYDIQNYMKAREGHQEDHHVART
jgi:calcineurin-like phosphoesterase family protein